VFACPGGARACANESLSAGRGVVGTGACGVGHRGNLCHRCEAHYALVVKGRCTLCDERSTLASGLAFGIIGLAVVAFFYWFLIWRPLTPGLNGKLTRTLSSVHSTLTRAGSKAGAYTRPCFGLYDVSTFVGYVGFFQ